MLFIFSSEYFPVVLMATLSVNFFLLAYLRLRRYFVINKEYALVVFAVSHTLGGFSFLSLCLLVGTRPVFNPAWLMVFTQTVWLIWCISFGTATLSEWRAFNHIVRLRKGISLDTPDQDGDKS